MNERKLDQLICVFLKDIVGEETAFGVFHSLYRRTDMLFGVVG
jgi:hypothetical protein